MIKGVLLDLSGTVHVNDVPVPGAIAAVQRLQDSGLPLRFVTNTSRKGRDMLHESLCRMGFGIDKEDIFTAPLAVRRYLEEHRLRPYLLVHGNLLKDFEGVDCDNPDAVVIGHAEDNFTYRNMNEAFRLLKRGVPLLATGRTRYFEKGDGLALDAGPFVTALEYAANTKAIVLGKPSASFFEKAASELGLRPSECVMIGDDAEADVAAAVAAGLQAFLVQTGKYREGDEAKVGGGQVAKDVAAAIDRIMSLAGQGE